MAISQCVHLELPFAVILIYNDFGSLNAEGYCVVLFYYIFSKGTQNYVEVIKYFRQI